MEKMNLSPPFVENAYELRVKRCCASCQHKELSRLMMTRLCRKHKASVYPYNVCRDWKMSEGLKYAGRSQGDVRDIRTKVVIF